MPGTLLRALHGLFYLISPHFSYLGPIIITTLQMVKLRLKEIL